MNLRHAIAVTAAVAALTLAAACSTDTGSDPSPKASTAASNSVPSEAACKKAMTAQMERLASDPNAVEEDVDTPKACRGLPTDRIKTLSATVMEEQTEQAAKPQPFRQPQITVGDTGTGELEVTPTTILDTTTATGETPDHDLFTIVTVKDKATSAAPAAEAAPMSGGGWKWIAKDGASIDAGDGNAAFNVVPNGFEGGGDVQPGTYDWRVAVFDLTKAQRKSGTLMYVDGSSTSYRWTLPAGDSGPQLAELKQGIR